MNGVAFLRLEKLSSPLYPPFAKFTPVLWRPALDFSCPRDLTKKLHPSRHSSSHYFRSNSREYNSERREESTRWSEGLDGIPHVHVCLWYFIACRAWLVVSRASSRGSENVVPNGGSLESRSIVWVYESSTVPQPQHRAPDRSFLEIAPRWVRPTSNSDVGPVLEIRTHSVLCFVIINFIIYKLAIFSFSQPQLRILIDKVIEFRPVRNFHSKIYS